MNLREQILGYDDLPKEKVLVPEWSSNGEPLELWVHTLTGTQRDRLEQLIVQERSESEDNTFRNIRARLVANSTYDADGSLVFREGDIDALGLKSAKPLDRLFAVAQRLSGFSDSDVKELAKNSERTTAEDSTSV